MQKEKLLTSNNGVRIYSYKNPSVHGFFISLFVKAGSMYETESTSGIAHFFEHASIRNVNKLYGMKLYSELDRYGLEFNASTFSEMIQFYVSGADVNFDRGAEMISKLLSPIILDKSEIDAERRRIKAEIRESDDKTSLTTFTNKTVFHNTSLALSIVGTNSAIDSISAKKLSEYQRGVLSSENIFFYVTGNFTEENLKGLCDRISSADLKSSVCRENLAPVPDSFGKRSGEIYVKNADFTSLRFTFDIDMTKYSIAEIDLVYDILLSGYNSKLFVEMSEKRGLFYDVGGSCERYRNIGTLSFTYEVKQKDIYDAIAITVDVLNSMKRDIESEVDCMTAPYVDNAYMLYDDSRELNFTFAYDNHIMDEKYSSVEDRRQRYKNITPDRLREISSDIFKLSNLTLTMKTASKKADKERMKKLLLPLG